MKALLRLPLAWGLVAVAAAIGLAMSFSYLGAFLDPLGNARGLPVAIVNEDAGGTAGAQRLVLGERAVALLRSPRSPLGNAVAWTPLPTRRAALAQIRQDKAFAAVVLPRDYSRRLATLAGPSRGVPTPVTVEVLTNPAAGSFARTATEELASRAAMTVSMQIAARVASTASAGATRAEIAHRVDDAVQVRARPARAPP